MPGFTRSRFRASYETAPLPTGRRPFGEVEGYSTLWVCPLCVPPKDEHYGVGVKGDSPGVTDLLVLVLSLAGAAFRWARSGR